jgi:hypothetical protein
MKAYLVNLALAIVAIFAPEKAAILTVVMLCLADLLFGVWAAKKRGEHLTSAGFARTLSKICVYETALCLAYVTQQYLTGPLMPVCKLLAALIGTTEIKSILENLDEIYGGNFFGAIIAKLGSKNDSPGGK